MKNRMIKMVTTVMVLLGLLVIGRQVNAQNKMANFAGTWKLNEDKSDFGRLTAASASRLKILQIIQTTENIIIHSGDPEAKSTVTVSLTGTQSRATITEVVSDITNTLTADIKLKIVSSRLFQTANRDPAGMFPLQKKTYTLSDDGKTLTINYGYQNDKGDQLLAGKLVYDRAMEGN